MKPQFYSKTRNSLIKATQPFERISIDFKGPLPSYTRNTYILVVIDEYSRFPFCFPCANMHAKTVINCLNELFCLCGVPGYVHSDNATSFRSGAIKAFLNSKGVATSHSSIYHPEGNSQVERSIGSVWQAVKLALKSRGLPVHRWEDVLPDVVHSMRSLLCTTSNATPHELFFNFKRKTFCGPSLPTWLMEPGPVLIRNFTRASKHDNVVQEVDLLHANPAYAKVRYPDGHEATVSLDDLAPTARYQNGKSQLSETVLDESSSIQASDVNKTNSSTPTPSSNDESISFPQESSRTYGDEPLEEPKKNSPTLRRSARCNKGIPPVRYGAAYSL